MSIFEGPTGAARPSTNSKSELEQAAKAMEAYFLRTLLKEVKALSTSTGAGASTFQDMFREALADSMAEGQGLGIAQLVAEDGHAGAAAQTQEPINHEKVRVDPQDIPKRSNLADGGE